MKTRKQTEREAKRLFRFCLLNGLLDEGRVRRVIQRVIESKRRGDLFLLSHLHRLVRLDRNRHFAEVLSVVELPADLRTRVEAGLRRMYGPAIHIQFSQLSSLIGGIRIRVGSDVYDGSVQSELAALERSF
jgi:F-type H+-transporting ATPase subunit delta